MDNAQNRRAEDKRAPGELQWGESTAGAASADSSRSAAAGSASPAATGLTDAFKAQVRVDFEALVRRNAGQHAMLERHGEESVFQCGRYIHEATEDQWIGYSARAAREVRAHSGASAEGIAQQLERIAASWDGHLTETKDGEEFDIGADLRREFAKLNLGHAGVGAEPPVEMARFCPHCGSVGDVEARYRDCCPDGSDARSIPRKLAEQCRELFKAALNSVASLSSDDVRNAATWQPIETVPKTGKVDLWANGRRFTGCHWDRVTGWRKIDHSGQIIHVSTPTHWMPLPAAPAAAQSVDDAGGAA